MAYRVSIHPAARTDLFDLDDHITAQSGTARAAEFIGRIERACRDLADFPERGVRRDDIAPGVRTIALERRVLIAFRVEDDAVVILRMLYAGRSFSAEQIPS